MNCILFCCYYYCYYNSELCFHYEKNCNMITYKKVINGGGETHSVSIRKYFVNENWRVFCNKQNLYSFIRNYKYISLAFVLKFHFSIRCLIFPSTVVLLCRCLLYLYKYTSWHIIDFNRFSIFITHVSCVLYDSDLCVDFTYFLNCQQTSNNDLTLSPTFIISMI